MARHLLHVRPAAPEDLTALLALGDELREQLLPGEASRGRGGRGGAEPARAALAARYREALEDRRRHLVVVVDEGAQDEVVGMALFSVGPSTALLDHAAVHVNHAVVADRHRRKGAGRALVAAAAAFAEERGLDQLVVSVHPGSRDANRFFARLGFAPVAVRRTTSVGALRRRLAQGELRAMEQVTRRRRLLVDRDLRLLGGGLPSPRHERRA